MNNPAIGYQSAAVRPGLLDRLVVRIDVFNHYKLLLIPIAITLISFSLNILSSSRPLLMVGMALGLFYMVWLVPTLLRDIYLSTHPNLSPRWLAAARAAFGNVIIDPAISHLRVIQSPDHILTRSELIDAIILYRKNLACDAKAVEGIRLRDLPKQG